MSHRSYVITTSRIVSFFFQAEDGIRCRNVTRVQTCALPIWPGRLLVEPVQSDDAEPAEGFRQCRVPRVAPGVPLSHELVHVEHSLLSLLRSPGCGHRARDRESVV